MSTRPEPTPISIWEPYQDAQGDIQFVRPQPQPLGDHYADRLQIPARKADGVYRICFFGESAAAGYLYAPYMTPAKVLAHHLQTAGDSAQYEVIDLARTNERLESLVVTVEQALQLNPDRLVIFSGNNWNLLETPELSPYYPSSTGRQELAAALQQNGFLGAAELAAKRLVEKVSWSYGHLQALAQQTHIPLTLIIPEVNHADWETRQPAPWLTGEQSRRWYDLYFSALEAISAVEWQTLMALADEMLTLDGEQCPTSWRLLALAHQALGNEDEARLAAELAITTTNYATLGFLSAPQISVLGQNLQRRAAEFHGFGVVDLPRILPQISGSPLCGRRFFADYCHLTAEGMHLAMAATAAEILARPWAGLLPTLTPYPIAPEALASARLGAAIHTAHRHLPVNPQNEIVKYWCLQALAASPKVATAMLDVVAARCAPLPAVLTSAQQRNVSSPFRLQHQHGWRYAHLDAILIDAITFVLADHDPVAHGRLLEMLVAAWGVGQERVDLLKNGFYLWEPLARFYPVTLPVADLTEWAMHRAPWPETSLAVVADGKNAVVITFTARLPRLPGRYQERADDAVVSINGRPFSTLALTDKWQTLMVTVPAELLRYGLNKLTIKWPPLPAHDGWVSMIAQLERGEAADLYPLFGELFQVWAQRLLV